MNATAKSLRIFPLMLAVSACTELADPTSEAGTDGTETGSDSTTETETGIDADTDTGAPEAECGNGVPEVDEECDEGLLNAANGPCTPECLINVCGDEYVFVDGLEECDDGNDVDTDACVSDCRLAACGDGFLHQGVESCDDGNATGEDGCSAQCIEEKVVSLAAGDLHTCAVLSTGGVRCWGSGQFGQLGYGNTNDIGDDEHPALVGDVDVGGAVVQVSAGADHTCALLDNGKVRCWGYSSVGALGYPGLDQVGDDETPASVGDVDVGGTAVQISAGGQHTCALLDTGKVRCWGYGASGRLGYGILETIGDDESPADAGDVLVGFYDVVQVAALRDHTCAIMSNGAVRCWGVGMHGQLGYGNKENIGDDEDPTVAGSVGIDYNAVQVTGGSHTCVRHDTGDVRCWGPYDYGVLGYPNLHENIGDDELPTAVDFVQIGYAAIDISAHYLHTCAVTEDGNICCWGYGAYGQLGYGNTIDVGDNEKPYAPVGHPEIDGIAVNVVTGAYHTCALLSTGAVRCWGLNNSGQLGIASTEAIGDDEKPNAIPPVQVL